jgi:phage I-like protein
MEIQFKATIKKKGKQATNMILYADEFVQGGNEITVTAADIKHGIDNFNSGIGCVMDEDGNHRIQGNYQHAKYEQDPEKSRASGWGYNLRLQNGQLVADIDWTEDAINYIEKEELQYISPEFWENWKDENGIEHGFTIVGFALTNVPFLKKKQKPVKLMDFGEIGDWINAKFERSYLREQVTGVMLEYVDFIWAQISAGNITDENELVNKLLATNSEYLETLKNACKKQEGLGMSEKLMAEFKVTDADALDAVVIEMKENYDKAKKEVEALMAEKAETEKQYSELTAKVEKLEKESIKKDAIAWVKKLTDAGKLVPAQENEFIELYLGDKELAEKIASNLQVVVKFDTEVGSGSGVEMVEKQKSQGISIRDKARAYAKEHNVSYQVALKKA